MGLFSLLLLLLLVHAVRGFNTQYYGYKIAGNGTTLSGYAGDGYQATSSTMRMRSPYGVSTDSSGNLYFCDSYNNVIRKVTKATGIISTYVGTGTAGFSGDNGAATSANLYTPSGLTIDSFDNMYIVDTYNHRIRKVSMSNSIINSVVGTYGGGTFGGDNDVATSALLNYPSSVAFTSGTSSDFYLTDTNNHRVRYVSDGGDISTIAGNGNTVFSGDNGQATSATLNYPQQVVYDTSGAGPGRNKILRITIYFT